MQTSLVVIENELKGKEVVNKISASLGKPTTDPSVMKYINGAMMVIAASSGTNADLTLCTKESIINSLINAATVKLPVDNRRLAYLVPYRNTCTFMPSFLGYIFKIKEADPTTDITVGIVYKGDKFTFRKRDGEASYDHVAANAFEDDPKNIVGMYCFMRTHTGSSIEIMSIAELQKVKAQSKMNSGFIWNTWELEMYKKTMIRRAGKMKFMEAVAELDTLDNKFFNERPVREVPKLSDSAPLPPEMIATPEAEVIQESMKDETEALEKRRLEIKEKYERENPPIETNDTSKELSETVPKEALEGIKGVTGIVSKHFNPVGASKYHSFCIDGYDKMYFQTDNDFWVEALIARTGTDDSVSLSYTETPWKKGTKSGINRTITGISVKDTQEKS